VRNDIQWKKIGRPKGNQGVQLVGEATQIQNVKKKENSPQEEGSPKSRGTGLTKRKGKIGTEGKQALRSSGQCSG